MSKPQDSFPNILRRLAHTVDEGSLVDGPGIPCYPGEGKSFVLIQVPTWLAQELRLAAECIEVGGAREAT
jgi:hypothetical protein